MKITLRIVRRPAIRMLWAALAACTVSPVAVCGVSDGITPESLQILPHDLVLSDASDTHRLLLTALSADGSHQDLTETAQWSVRDPAIAEIREGRIYPVSDGTTEVEAVINGVSKSAAVTVVNSAAVPTLSFRTNVLAILTKAGCNSGKCHGAASGKDGFRLSLFGYDPPGDHYRLTREMNGRRINTASPETCLFIAKALGNVDHTGGGPIVEGTPHYQVLIDWINNGAAGDTSETPVPTGIKVYPENAVFASANKTQQLIVLAEFNDGSVRDVTDRAVFLSNNDAAASVATDGVVQANGRGSAFVMARFDQYTEGCSIIVRPGVPYHFPDIPAENKIDELVYRRWQELHLLPSELCSDEVFLRRAFLDLTGVLPTEAEQAEFLTDPSNEKRSALVDALIERPEFTDIWVMKWAEMLQIRTTNGVSPKGLLLYDRWLRERVHQGETVDQIVREILSATGGTFENPATSYFQTETTPQLLAENIAQSMLGTRIQCAQCHNHPFDRWTMDDYYGFSAFFSQVGYKQARDPREIMVFNAGEGVLKHPVGDRTVVPTFLGSGIPEIPDAVDYRRVVADWIVSEQNPAFARNLANVVWAHFFGIGIVEPVDDMRVSNPPSNPALLQALATQLAADQYDIRPLIRMICTSRTYQLETRRNESNKLDERHFSHAKIRRLRAEILLDTITQVTGTTDEFRGLPAGSRAVHVPDGQTPNYFLTTFGRSTRNTSCSCEVRTSPTLSQALHLLNGESTTGKIKEGGVVESLLADNSDTNAVVERLYQRCLCRRPTESEMNAIKQRVDSSADRTQALHDLFWALLNSNEFIFNH